MTLMMDSPRLRELTRAQIQSLAKREVVRAIGKTEDIIRRLMRKHPKGVPVPENAHNPSVSLAPPKRNVLRKSRRGTPSLSQLPGHSEDHTDVKGKGKALAEAASPSPSSSAEALEQLLYPEDEELVAGPFIMNPESTPAPLVAESEVLPDHPAPFSRKQSPVLQSESPSHQVHNQDEGARGGALPPEVPDPDWQADEENESDVYDAADYPKGAPTHYMVVDALRQFTTLANTIPSLETRIAEGRCLLQRTETLLKKATPDVRELVVTREYLETFLLAKMKQKRELWDGTAKMKKKDRKLRMEWLRAERKVENEKRWKEASKLYEKKGLKPEPFSAFASESDEEVIESLQTTPTSSKNGSSKRAREESVGNDSNTSDGSQRKRARS